MNDYGAKDEAIYERADLTHAISTLKMTDMVDGKDEVVMDGGGVIVMNVVSHVALLMGLHDVVYLIYVALIEQR